MTAGIRGKRLPWRLLQIAINLGTIVTGFCTFMPLAYTSMYFSWQCVLYTDVRVTFVNTTVLKVDTDHTIWGLRNQCRYPTYAPLMAGIHAFIWCWFFLLMKTQLKAEHREFPLLVTSFILHSIMCIVVFVSSSMISAGVDTWCHGLVKALEDNKNSMSCSETEDLYWPSTFQDGKKHPIYSFLLTAKVSSWLQTLTVLGQSVVCGYKLYEWILGTTGGKLDIRKCGQMSKSHTGSSNVGYNSDNEDLLTFMESDDDQSVDITIHAPQQQSQPSQQPSQEGTSQQTQQLSQQGPSQNATKQSHQLER